MYRGSLKGDDGHRYRTKGEGERHREKERVKDKERVFERDADAKEIKTDTGKEREE